MSWQDDFQFGQSAEFRVAVELLHAGWQVQFKGAMSVRDLGVWTPYGPEAVEVKREDNKAHTGNICIECYQGRTVRRPSGIKVSESSVFIHTLGDRCALYRTQPMRCWLQDHVKELDFRDFGDNGNRGIILPLVRLTPLGFADVLDFKALTKSKVWKLAAGNAPIAASA